MRAGQNIRTRPNIVYAVAVRASRQIAVALGKGNTMRAGLVFFHLEVAGTAINRGQTLGMGQFFDIAVAGNAAHGGVNRLKVGLLVDIERNDLPVCRRGRGIGIAMAHET